MRQVDRKQVRRAQSGWNLVTHSVSRSFFLLLDDSTNWRQNLESMGILTKDGWNLGETLVNRRPAEWLCWMAMSRNVFFLPGLLEHVQPFGHLASHVPTCPKCFTRSPGASCESIARTGRYPQAAPGKARGWKREASQWTGQGAGFLWIPVPVPVIVWLQCGAPKTWCVLCVINLYKPI